MDKMDGRWERACVGLGRPSRAANPADPSSTHPWHSLQTKNRKTNPLRPLLSSQKKKFSTASIVGAPAQHNQGSRKGKRAWRKNVDIEDLEEKLEGLREEERTFGLTLQKKADGDLFVVDTKGDDKVRKSLPRFSRTTLRSHQIISQRSAVPAVYARPRRSVVSPREKERLLRIARKDRRGPLNSIVDPSQPGEGSALLEVSEAVKKKRSIRHVVHADECDIGRRNQSQGVSALSLPSFQLKRGKSSYMPPVC